MMIIMMMMSTDNRNRRHFKTRKKLRDYWICLWDEYHRNNDGIILIFFRPLFAIMHLTGVIIKDTTFLEERLGSTDRNQRYPPTGTHPSPRSVSAWRSENSSGSLSSTSKLTLCFHWSLMGNTAPPYWVVTSGKSWLVRKDYYSTTAKKKGLMSFVVGVGIIKPELVLLAKTRIVVARATQGSDLAQKGTLTPQTRVVTRPLSIQIMETNT